MRDAKSRELEENPDKTQALSETHESNQSLWLLTIAPSLWAVHFLASYLTAAIWCAKVVDRGGSLETVRILIGVYTLVALFGIGWTGWLAYQRQSLGEAVTPHHGDTPEDRHRFLGFATLLLSGLSFVATIYVAMAAVFMETCQ
jgi:hypothetical protein